MEIRVYEPADQARWDAFIATAKNATFLFYRNYMDYHADRFQDYSLMVLDENESIKALLPANRMADQLVSHGGLTYGGFIIDATMAVSIMLEIFETAYKYLRSNTIKHWIYKPVPHIYHTVPAEEDLYALFRLGARPYRRDVLTVVDYRKSPAYQERRYRSIRKGRQAGIECRETSDYDQFWNILTNNLRKRYNLQPVHTVDEIKLLAGYFPNEIRLYGAYLGNVMLAGAVAYISHNVCHVQYNAASEDGKRQGALDVIMDDLLKLYEASKRYFDFGVSTENNGQYLNTGLAEYKEGFGGRTIVHDLYEINLV
jgi:hypothetical protein